MNEHDSRDDQFDETLSGDHESAPPSIDERASDWLDRAGLNGDSPQSRSVDGEIIQSTAADDSALLQDLEALDQPSARRVADMQFLHVLLNELHHGTTELNSARVQRAMAAIRDEPSFIGEAAVAARSVATDSVAATATPLGAAVSVAETAPHDIGEKVPLPWSPSVTSRRNWLIPAAAIAATLTGLALWLTPPGTASSAYAAVQRVAADARILKDRRYRVTQSLNFDQGEQGDLESTLYVRGGEKFALEHRGPMGMAWMGSNGREGWLIPALGPPIITDNPRYPARWAREEGLALPDLQLTGLLDLMKERFQLTLLPREPLPDRPEVLCERISGRCNANDGGANRIELWAHPETGVAQRLVLEWNRAPDEAGLTAVQLDLLAEEPQPDVWYEAEGHRHPRPILRRIPILPSAP